MIIQIVLFLLVTITVAFIATKRFNRIFRMIMLGKEGTLPNDHSGIRWKNMIMFALGQKKMFEKPISGIFHLFIYVAFLFTQIDLIEIVIDGISGQHRILRPFLSILYPLMINFIEILSVLAFIATIVFLLRRNVLRLDRFQKPELRGWPFRDANLILCGEILLITGIFLMNGADQVLQDRHYGHYINTGNLYMSGMLVSPSLSELSNASLVMIERLGWWLHYLVILGFILYLPFSKHLHIFLAFPQAYFSKLSSRGMMSPMFAIENEVRSMLGQEPTHSETVAVEDFGAKDVFDLDQRVLLSAMTCTECGRCTQLCPANQTGKVLSPRKIVMDVRDRMEDISTMSAKISVERVNSKLQFDDGKSLFDKISAEELYACTSCNACVEACPVLIDPLEIILQMRRYDILVNSSGPAEWLPMFNSLENNQSVWSLSASRTEWLNENI